MNLVGHVAVALAPDAALPSTDFLVGCMLPDLAAIARVVELDATPELAIGARQADPRDRGEVGKHAPDQEVRRGGRGVGIDRDRDVPDQVHRRSVPTTLVVTGP
jgi:hypothetical protein